MTGNVKTLYAAFAAAAFALLLLSHSGAFAQNEANMKSAPSSAPASNAPASKLGATQDPVACDCSNCSAEHCQPKPVPGRLKFNDITLKRGY